MEDFMIILPFIGSYKNLEMLNTNFIKTNNNIKYIYTVDGGTF
jgi:hypothetical protein